MRKVGCGLIVLIAAATLMSSPAAWAEPDSAWVKALSCSFGSGAEALVVDQTDSGEKLSYQLVIRDVKLVDEVLNHSAGDPCFEQAFAKNDHREIIAEADYIGNGSYTVFACGRGRGIYLYKSHGSNYRLYINLCKTDMVLDMICRP